MTARTLAPEAAENAALRIHGLLVDAKATMDAGSWPKALLMYAEANELMREVELGARESGDHSFTSRVIGLVTEYSNAAGERGTL